MVSFLIPCFEHESFLLLRLNMCGAVHCHCFSILDAVATFRFLRPCVAFTLSPTCKIERNRSTDTRQYGLSECPTRGIVESVHARSQPLLFMLL